MSLFQTIRRDALTLAMVMGADDGVARQQLESFLTSGGVSAGTRYFSQFSMTKHNVRTVSYIHYAEVPAGIKTTAPVKLIPVPACLYVVFTISVAEMDRLADGAYNEPFKDYLNSIGARMELFPMVLAHVNETENTITVQIPFKKQ